MSHAVVAPASKALRTKLKASGVNMVFSRDGKSTNVLDNVDLEVGEGEFLCLLGPSGCGKSTLLQVICGMTLPSHGELRVTGRVAPVLALGSGAMQAAYS